MLKELFTCKEVAARYHVSEDTVWRWIRTKKRSIPWKNHISRALDPIAGSVSQLRVYHGSSGCHLLWGGAWATEAG